MKQKAEYFNNYSNESNYEADSLDITLSQNSTLNISEKCMRSNPFVSLKMNIKTISRDRLVIYFWFLTGLKRTEK